MNSSFILVSSEYSTSFWRTKGLFGERLANLRFDLILFIQSRGFVLVTPPNTVQLFIFYCADRDFNISLCELFKIQLPGISAFLSGVWWDCEENFMEYLLRNISFDICSTN